MPNLILRFSLVSALFFSLSQTFAAEEKPNLIYILLDDAGYGDLSCYGQEKFSTPNIDRLAEEGIKFTDHYSGSTVCAPTRCVLMTGKHIGHAYVRGNREVKPEGQAPMPADIVTIPRLLDDVGYTTGAFGKWGLGAPGSESDPAKHFDLFYGYNCQREAHTYYPDHLWKNYEKIELDGETYTHPLIMDEALDFVRENKDEPFFVYLPVTIPHAAMHVTEEYAAPFEEKWPEFNDEVGRYAGTEVKNPIAAFAGMMTLLDDGVGDLLALLEELGIDKNTLVILSSDNGPHKEGGHDPDFFDSNGPLTGYKRDLTEGGIRAPMVARWPGKIAPGTVTDLPSAHWDILPTLCELGGVKIPADIDGISLVPTLLREGTQEHHRYLYWEFYERGGKKAARWGNWKAVQTGINSDPDAPIAIYDLSEDIAEENDLSSERPELVEKAKEIFAEAHEPSPNWEFSDKKTKSKKKTKTASIEQVCSEFVSNYCEIVYATYRDSLAAAQDLEKAIVAFVDAPDQAKLDAAKDAWLEARVPYLQTEAFRFYAGPIDDDEGPEPLINGWPMDEYHVDYVEGAPESGVIGDAATFPEITKELISDLNEKAGETAITSGYHAIEFLLWGQDLNADSAGQRPFTDYTTAANADRRGQYLKVCADLLTDHLSFLSDEWAPGKKDNFRAAFTAKPAVEAARTIVYGIQFLSGRELAGERLLVAWDTQEQEDEHSCFSDTTHLDAKFDAKGIENVYRGTYKTTNGKTITGLGARALVRTLKPNQVDEFDEKMKEVTEAVGSIPSPFDQAILGGNDDPGRKAILSAVENLEDFAALLAELEQELIGASKG